MANNYVQKNRPYYIPVWRTSRTSIGVRKNMRTKYGKENKRRYRHFKSKFYNLGYKWLMRFANNNFNFKFDYMVNVSILSGYARKIIFTVSEARLSDEFNMLEPFYGVNNNVESQWTNLAKLYKYYKVSAIKVRFKAMQTVDSQIFRPGASIADQSAANMPELYLKHIPNIMVQIMTQNEHAAFPLAEDIKTIQRQLDRPYSRIISADDDAKFYRTFPSRPNYDSYTNQNDDVLFHIVPTIQSNGQIWFRMYLTDAFKSNPQYDWPLGTLHITVYSTFKNSTI